MRKTKLKITAMVMAIVMIFMALPVSASERDSRPPTGYTQPPTIGISVGDDLRMEEASVTVTAVIAILSAATGGMYATGLAVGEDLAWRGVGLHSAEAYVWRAGALAVFGPIGLISFNLGLSNGWNRTMS